MKKIKLKKGYIAGVLALLFTLATAVVPPAYGVVAIDTKAACSLTLQVGEGDQLKEELSALTLQASLYRVATISETGAYTVVEDTFGELDLSDIDNKTTAKIWQEKAAAADAIVEKDKVEADYTMEAITGGKGTQENIAQGMYLVRMAPVQDDFYEYSFMPFLISVPNNRYYQTKDDSWIYQVTADIKPEQTPRLSAVEIVKTLPEYYTELGTPMFVFQIEAVDRKGATVYSNVAGISFDGSGSKKIRIDGIPAGSTVTVTEVYGGSSYELTSGAQTQSIENIAAEKTESVTFVNTYNDKLIPGTGVVNHFEKDANDVQNDGWKHSSHTVSPDSTLKAYVGPQDPSGPQESSGSQESSSPQE